MVVQIQRWQFTVADFARMAEVGIFAQDDRVELIDGEVRAMRPIGPRHAAIVKWLNTLLGRQVAGLAIVSVQAPIQLTDYTEPQPDIAVLRLQEDFYAQARIPEVWRIDVERETVTQYTQSDGRHYRREQVLQRHHILVSTALRPIQLAVNDIFG